MRKKAFGRGHGLQSKGLRNKKRRKLILWILIIVALPTLTVVGLSYGSYLRPLQIDTVTVKGNNTLPADAIVAAAQARMSVPILGIFSRATRFTYPREQIVADIASSSPRIKAVSVKARGLKSVEVTLMERMPQAVWCSESDECSYIDDTGLLYEATTTESKASLFTFTGHISDNYVSYLKNALEFQKGINALGFESTSIHLMPEDDAELNLKNGLILKIALSDDMSSRLDAFRTLLSDQSFKQKITSNKLSYIDLRFGNKIYYKAKGGADPETATSVEKKTGQ